MLTGAFRTRRRRGAGLVALLLAGSLVAPLSGCFARCAETRLEVSPVEVTDIRTPLTISARLTQDGQPFAGVEVKLAVNVVGPNNAHSEALFYATTDADGWASVTRPEGIAGRSPRDYRVTGYSAYFQPLNKIDGADYCWSNAGAPITCRTDAGSGDCPTGGSMPSPR